MSALTLAVFATSLLAAQTSPESAKYFETNIRPLLASQCFSCHSSKSKMTFGGLKMDQRASFFQGGQSGPLVVPGKPEQSRLLEVVNYAGALKMPPSGKLKPEQIATLTEWVKMGAPWPEESNAALEAEQKSKAALDAQRRQYWAWQPVRKPAADATIDRFILAKLAEKQIPHAPAADKRTLIRRAYFDLAGLPPTASEVQAFLADSSPDAFAKVVDRLLASPHFGERWGRHWLDLTYFADNLEIGRKIPAKEAWRYRDYVIDAFQQDKPYPQFIKEQIAGDLLPADTDPQRREQVIATGFLALGPWPLVAADKEQLRMDVVDLQLDLVGKAFLGLTMGCARCHDHKFDPIPAKDYYAMAGILGSTLTLDGRIDGIFSDVHRTPLPETPAEMRTRAQETEKYLATYTDLKKKLKALTDEKEQLKKAEKPVADLDKQIGELNKSLGQLEFNRPEPPMALSVRDVDTPADHKINIRGNSHLLGELVPRSFVQVAMWSGPPQLGYRASGRLEMADWIANEKNPLTARVMVNRLWQHLFGAGLVRSVDNFGLRGELPSHPELLDYLATRFMDQGWSVKKIIREIMLSETYRQSSAHVGKAAEADPENRLVWRMNRRRLEGETIRDSVLALTGSLDERRGGPSLPLEVPGNLNVGKPVEFRDDAKLPDELLKRRTVYLPVLRKSQHKSLDILNLFDFPDVNQVNGARSVTTVPTQALYLINSPFLQEQAKQLSILAAEHATSGPARVQWLIERVLGRVAVPADQSRASEFLTSFAAELKASGEANPEATAWARYCHSLLVSNEFLYLK